MVFLKYVTGLGGIILGAVKRTDFIGYMQANGYPDFDLPPMSLELSAYLVTCLGLGFAGGLALDYTVGRRVKKYFDGRVTKKGLEIVKRRDEEYIAKQKEERKNHDKAAQILGMSRSKAEVSKASSIPDYLPPDSRLHAGEVDPFLHKYLKTGAQKIEEKTET